MIENTKVKEHMMDCTSSESTKAGVIFEHDVFPRWCPNYYNIAV